MKGDNALHNLDLDSIPYPELSSLTLDEAAVLFDISGLVQEDFVPAHPDATPAEKQMRDQTVITAARNPRFRQAMLQIAIRRAHPSMETADITKAATGMQAVDVARWFWDGDDDNPPTASSQSAPEQLPSSEQRSSSERSGSSSTTESAPVVDLPLRTGTTG